MVEKQVKKPSAGYAVFVAIIGALLIAALFGDFQMSLISGKISRINFIDLIRVFTQLFPKISAGGDELKLYVYNNFEALLYVVAIVGCLVTYFVHIVRYFIAVANFKEEKDTRRMTSNLAGFTYTGLIFSALSFLLSFELVKGTDNSIAASIPGWGGLLAILASIIGFIVLTVKAGKDDRKVGVLKTFGALTVLFASLCGLLTYGTLLNYGGFVTPITALREALYGHLANGDPITRVIYAGAGIVLAGATLILYKGIVRNVLETKAYFKEEKEKKYNPQIRILVYVLVATVLYAGGIVMYILAKVPSFELSYFVYIAGGLHVLPLIFAICYAAKYGKNRPLPVVQPKKEESSEESSLEEEVPVEEVKAEEQPVEEVKEEEKTEPEVEAEPEEEKPQPGYFDFFKPVSKPTTNAEELNEPKPEEDIPVYQEVSPAEKETIQGDDEEVEEPVSEEAPVTPVVEEAPAEEEKAEEQPVEEVSKEEEKPAPEKKTALKKSEEGEKKESPKKPAGEKKDAPAYRTYHLVKRDDGKWEVKFAGGQKAIKLFNTQKEAVEYAKVLAENQGGTYLIHNSKGANKGRIQKK